MTAKCTPIIHGALPPQLPSSCDTRVHLNSPQIIILLQKTSRKELDTKCYRCASCATASIDEWIMWNYVPCTSGCRVGQWIWVLRCRSMPAKRKAQLRKKKSVTENGSRCQCHLLCRLQRSQQVSEKKPTILISEGFCPERWVSLRSLP